VEDSSEMRARVDRELEAMPDVELVGYSETAAGAILAIREARPDVVVLDLHLSEGSGLDVLKSLSRDLPKPVVLVLTNQSDSTSRERSLRAGAGYFFDKSTEIEDFFAALRSVRSTPA
jgi:DNA-binding NarL/FixJ family response regulator